MKLSEATGIDVKEQELLLASGQAVKPKTLVMDCIKNDQVRNNETLRYQCNCCCCVYCCCHRNLGHYKLVFSDDK